MSTMELTTGPPGITDVFVKLGAREDATEKEKARLREVDAIAAAACVSREFEGSTQKTEAVSVKRRGEQDGAVKQQPSLVDSVLYGAVTEVSRCMFHGGVRACVH